MKITYTVDGNTQLDESDADDYGSAVCDYIRDQLNLDENDIVEYNTQLNISGCTPCSIECDEPRKLAKLIMGREIEDYEVNDIINDFDSRIWDNVVW